MHGLVRSFGLLFIASLFISVAFAQNSGLPRIKKHEGYKTVRIKMLKAGWKPYHAPDADPCDGDERCVGRPEMAACAGTGLAPCRFLWKKKGKMVAIVTVGENAAFDGFQF